jgi:hypothetical protein
MDKANQMIQKFTREGVDQFLFNNLSNAFPKWRQENRIQQRKDAANKRWKKKKLTRQPKGKNGPPHRAK